MINYLVTINNDNTVSFVLQSVSGAIVEFEYGNFLRVVPIGAGFSGSLGFGELVLMINENSSGELLSPCYEAEADRLQLVSKIHSSMEAYNG